MCRARLRYVSKILVSTKAGASSEARRYFVEEFGLSELLGMTAPVLERL